MPGRTSRSSRRWAAHQGAGGEVGVTAAQLALKFVLDRTDIACVIVGMKTVQHVDDNLNAGRDARTRKPLIETARATIEVELFADEGRAPWRISRSLPTRTSTTGPSSIADPELNDPGRHPYSKTGKDPSAPRPRVHDQVRDAENTHKHVAGTLSMAHAARIRAAASSSFATHPNGNLDGVHTVFGQVTRG